MVHLLILAALSWHGGLHGCRISNVQAHHILERPLEYQGSLLGVKAEVLLFRKKERAVVTLSGVPLGGSITGVAKFNKDGFGVDLDAELEAALKRRRITIQGAGALHDYSKVWVMIQLPLRIGRYTLSLDRQYD